MANLSPNTYLFLAGFCEILSTRNLVLIVTACCIFFLALGVLIGALAVVQCNKHKSPTGPANTVKGPFVHKDGFTAKDSNNSRQTSIELVDNVAYAQVKNTRS